MCSLQKSLKSNYIQTAKLTIKSYSSIINYIKSSITILVKSHHKVLRAWYHHYKYVMQVLNGEYMRNQPLHNGSINPCTMVDCNHDQ